MFVFGAKNIMVKRERTKCRLIHCHWSKSYYL